jgi:succinate dehydrogenase/fumarate reductase flavoprotein subunit
VRAREQGAEVILADKNFVGKTGCSHYARDCMVFKEEWGDDYDEWMQQFVQIGEYIVDREWVDILLSESYPRFRDLIDWGQRFYLKNGSVGRPEPEEEPFRHKLRPTKYRKTSVIAKYGTRHKMLIFRRKVIRSGATVLDRVMITDLIKKDGRVVGASGFHARTGEFYVIEAKAVVIASGGLSFRGAGWGRWMSAGEGLAMGYRAGAELTSMEFGQGMYVVSDCETVVVNGPIAEIGKKVDAITNAHGEEFLGANAHIPINILWPLEVHKGNGPLYHEAYGIDRVEYKEPLEQYNKTAEGPWIEMLDRIGIDIFNDRFEEYMSFEGTFFTGGLRINTDCETSVPGLYAVGDASGTNFTGPTYSALGSGTAGACITGHRAGQSASRFCREHDHPSLTSADIAELRQATLGPLERTSGFDPAHVRGRVQQTLFPYEIMAVRHETRLQAALTMVEFFRDQFVPKLFVSDPHDLRSAQEVRSMVTGAEMMLRTSMFRTESRGWFFREDYPRRDDANWLKWVMTRRNGDEMEVWSEPVPEKYHGDTSLPYEERYPLQYGWSA